MQGRRARTILLRMLALMLWCASSGAGAEPPLNRQREPERAIVRIAIRFHVANENGEPVASDDFLREQLAHANAIYEPLGLSFGAGKPVPLAARHARLNTRRERDALARYAHPIALHCFVVAQLMDVDELGRERRGVHWTPRAAPARHFVILSKISGPYVLAHELGHFFGNPAHSPTPGNLMSYERRDEPPFLDPPQAERVRQTLRAMLESGALVRESSAR